MENIVRKIFDAMGSADTVDFGYVVSRLEPRERQQLHAVMRQLKREKRAWRRVSVIEGNSVVEIVRGAHPNAASE